MTCAGVMPGLDHQLELHVLAKSLEPGQHAAVGAVPDAHARVGEPLQIFLRRLQDARVPREIFVARQRLVVLGRLQDCPAGRLSRPRAKNGSFRNGPGSSNMKVAHSR